jgi:branched-chain amino acid transport system substrate-binding protein
MAPGQLQPVLDRVVDPCQPRRAQSRPTKSTVSFMNMSQRIPFLISIALLVLAAGDPTALLAQEPLIKIGLVQSFTGSQVYAVYARQVKRGFDLGLEYATSGTMQLLNRKIDVIDEDDQSKPDVAKQKVTKLYADDDVALVVGTTSSAAAVAVLPVAARFKKVLIVEPAVADSITGENWNRYVFRTGRTFTQDAIANALAVAKPDVSIATIARDDEFGRNGVAAYKAAVQKAGATVVHEEYTPLTTTDFTAPIQNIVAALKDRPGEKYLFVVWGGKGGPLPRLVDNGLDEHGTTLLHDLYRRVRGLASGRNPIDGLKALNEHGITLSYDLYRLVSGLTSGSNVIDGLKALNGRRLEGMVGGAYYYHEIPKNPVNDWLVREHLKRFNEPPDFFACGGFAAAMAVVAGIRKAGGTDSERLVAAMEGLDFETPKGKMTFRKEDHQALQSMYAFRMASKPGVAWLVPTLVRELSPQETAPAIANKR